MSQPVRRNAAKVRNAFAGPGEGSGLIVGGSFAILVLFTLMYLITHTDADTWVPIVVVVILVLLSLPICALLSGSPRDSKLFRLLALGMVLKLLMAGPRYYLSEIYYKGEGDAGRYHQAGVYFITNLSHGRWDIAPSELSFFPRETRIVGYIVGVVYTGIGTSYFGGFLAFSWISWLGLVCFFRAFQIAYPTAPPYLLATLLLFFPSLIFWPSSLGKEAVMVFLIGLFTVGVARILSNRKLWLGLIWATLGGLGMLQIRPHLLLVSATALALTTLAKREGQTGFRGAVGRVLVLILVVPVLITSMSKVDNVFGSSGGKSLTSNLNETVARTEIGGSSFDTRPVRGPQDIPLAILTVLYRPFVFEARSLTVMIAALEGLALMVLTILSARWIWKIFPAIYRWPFAAYCGGWVLMFVVAFSNIGNAGILARQRVQMFPLLILLVAITREYHRLDMLALEEEAAAEEELRAASESITNLPAPQVIS